MKHVYAKAVPIYFLFSSRVIGNFNGTSVSLV